MEREHLEQFLEKEYRLGFVKQTDDYNFKGWILLSKRKPNDRVLSILAPGEEPEYVSKQELFRRRPYQVQVIELKSESLRSDYESQEDYRLNEVHYFASLTEVEEFVKTFGHRLQDIKWLTEIEAP